MGGRVLIAGLLLAAAGGPAAAQPKAAFPAGEAEYEAVLNWMTGADGEARDRFVEEAGKAVEGNTDPVAVAQVDLLRAVAREGRAAPDEVIKEYGKVADVRRDAPLYRATAAVRVAQLQEEGHNRPGAARALAYARRTHPGGQVWVLRGATWQPEPVEPLAEREFDRLYAGRVEYRAVRGLAAALPFTGAARFLVFLVLVFAAVRLITLPWFLKMAPEWDRWIGEDNRPPDRRQLYIALWFGLEFAMLTLVGWLTPSWQFVFDLDRTPFLWVPALTDLNPGTRVVKIAAAMLFLHALMWPQYRQKPAAAVVMTAVVIAAGWYATRSELAWGNLLGTVQFLTGAAVVLGYRVWNARRPGAAG